MCGIVAYIGKKQAYPILIKGLHRLEYRGYDSAGVALVNTSNELKVFKAKGKVADLEAYAKGKDISGTIGIAHTRWATHGEPNDSKARANAATSLFHDRCNCNRFLCDRAACAGASDSCSHAKNRARDHALFFRKRAHYGPQQGALS